MRIRLTAITVAASFRGAVRKQRTDDKVGNRSRRGGPMSQTHSGYYRQPTIHGDTLVFVCETDLWSVSCQGGTARRLTAHQLDASWPYISPDGQFIAFSAMEEGATEVYLIAIDGGQARR